MNPFRDEELSKLHAQVNDLTDENARLRKKAQQEPREPIDIQSVIQGTTYVVITGAVCFALYCAGMVLAASHKVEYCYIATYSNSLKSTPCNSGMPAGSVCLVGHIDWAADQLISQHGNVNDAVKAAEQMRCPLGTGTVAK